MTTDRGTLAALLATMTTLASASPALAQTEQTAPVRGLEGLANGSPQTNTIPVPDAPKIVLPSETPAPRRTSRPRTAESTTAERPAAGKTPAGETATGKTATGKTATGKTATGKTATGRTAAERPVAERSTTRNESATRQAPTSTPTSSAPTPSPASADRTPVPTPVSEPATSPPPSEPPSTDVVSATPQSAPVPGTTTPSTVAAPETGRAMPLWLSLAVIVVVLGALWALRRKPRGRRFDRAADRAYVETVVEPTPEPFASEPISTTVVAAPRPVEPVAAPVVPATPAAVPATPAAAAPPAAAPKFLEPRAKTPPPPPAVPRARVTCDLRPLRAGLNLLSATVECELVVTNTGNAPAEAIRTGVALLTAHTGQDTDLAQFNAAPVGRPAAAPFTLAPGETRTIRTVVAIAREAIQTMTAANRPMFVPVVATNIVYTTAGDGAQTARAWSIGIERVDSAKLAPFWFDAPARMYSSVAARPHATEFES